jgi:hypothetical protein
MPGFNQSQLNYKVRNANGVSIMIGDQLIGFGQSSSPNQDYGTDVLYGIGSAKPQEIQQLKFGQTITLDSFQLTTEGMAYFGLAADLGTILANNEFNIFLLDNLGQAILSYVGCVANSKSMSISANQIITENITFSAMDVLGPDGTSLLDSNSADVFNALASSVAVPVITPGG